MTCRPDPRLGYRVLPGRHADDCPGEPCTGCQPCTARHCVVCTRGHCDDTSPQTCAECVGTVREDLTCVVEMHDRLEDQACHTHADGRLNAGPLGGDAMVLLAEGRYLPPSRWSEERRNDPVPPLLVLATWEDDWRIELGHGGGPRATLWRCADYLGTHLTMMAQRHLAFDEFAADVARVRGRLEAVLCEGEQTETGAPCMSTRDDGRECNTPLVKHYGRTAAFDHWKCPRCRTTYTAAEYVQAVARDYQDNATAQHADAIQRRTGVHIGTIRVWVNRGKVRTWGKDERGRVLYDVADVERHAEGEVA